MILLIAFGASLLPSTFEVSRETTIARSPAQIYAILSDLQQWKDWDPWQSSDAELKLRIKASGTTGMEGEWLREEVLEGKISLTRTTEAKRIDISFQRGGDPQRNLVFELKDLGNKTRLKWTVHGENGMYPFGNLFALQMEQYVGPVYEEALRKLKAYAESQPVTK